MAGARASKFGSFLAVAAASALPLSGLSGAAWADPPPLGSACTIEGTVGADVLTGTSGADVICGLGGDDTINALGGEDLVIAGPGADTVDGGPGNDDLRGGPGDDDLSGGSGADGVYGDGDNDTADGGPGTDEVSGRAGDDVLTGGLDADQVFGQDGADQAMGAAGDDKVVGGAGDDDVRGNTGADRVLGNDGDDLVYGSDQDDILRGGSGNDDLYGQPGDDVLHDRDGAGNVDAAHCGDGADVANIDTFDTADADCEDANVLDRDDPVAVDDTKTVVEDSVTRPIEVLANDTDADGGPIGVASVTDPADGTVTIAASKKRVFYTPDADYCNTPPGTTPDTFDYTLAPGGSTATVSVKVACRPDVPVAEDDTATVTEDDQATTIDVLANDEDAGNVVTIASVDTTSTNGTVTITNGGADLTYEPNDDYCNDGTPTDDFTYTLDPGGDTATVAVTVTCVNDAPVPGNDTAAVAEDAPATTIDVLGNDSDVEGDPFAVDIVADPVNGTATITNGGADISYQPDPNYCNDGITTDDFTYQLSPGGLAATVAVTVTCVLDPAVAADDDTDVIEDAPATTIDVLANDTQGETGALSITAVSDPANGTATITNFGADLTYEPDPDYCNDPPGNADDTFTYTLGPDGDQATVAVTVACINDLPVADDESYTGSNAAVGNTVLVHDDATDAAPTEAGPHKVVTGDLLDGDTDIDSAGPLTITSETVTSVDGGSAVIQADGDFVFTPAAGTSCTDTFDSFAYTLNDGDGGTDFGEVTVEMTGCVWYVDNTATAGGMGVSNAPFDTLTEAETASGANHTIFVFDGDATSTGYGGDGLVLKAGQRLLGEHNGLQVGGDTLHTANPGARPTLTASNADVVTLDDDNVLRGLVIDPSGTGGGIAGGSGDTNGTIAEVDIIDGGAPGNQPGLELDATSGTFAVSDLTVSTSGATGVRLASAGTVGFAGVGTISVTTTGAKALDLAGTNLGTSVFDSVTVTGSGSGGVSATSTTGSLTFGDLSLTTTSGTAPAFALNSAAAVTVPASDTANLSATGGPAVDVINSSAAALSFDGVTSTNSATDGVNLDGLGTGGFSASSGSISGASGIAFDLNGGSGDVTYPGTVTNGSGSSADVTGRTGGTVTLSGSITDGSDAGGGISVSSNTGGSTVFSGTTVLDTGASHAVSMTSSDGHTMRFTAGGLLLTTSSGRGFNAENSGTVAVTGANNTINSFGGGRALSVVNTDIGADDLTFRSLSASGNGLQGIVLDTTGSLGNLVVTGAGGPGGCTNVDQTGCTGGTITNVTGGDDGLDQVPDGTAIVLRNTTAPSFTRIHINNATNYGIRGTNVNGLTLADSVLRGVLGNSALTDNKDGGLRFVELTGTVSVTNTVVTGGYFTNIMVDNTQGTLNATFNNVDSLALDATGGDDAVQFEGIGTSDMNVVYQNSQVTTATGDLFQYIGDGTGGGDLDLVSNAFTNNEPSIATGGGGLAIVAGAKGPATLDILNNTMRDSLTNMLTIIKSRDVAAGTNNLVANITGNTIGTPGTANSGSVEGDGMEISTFGDGNATFNVTNNAIHQYNSSGIQFVAGGGVAESGQFNLNISGNTVSNSGTNPNITLLQGIRVDSGVDGGDTFATCVDFGPNSITGSSDAANKDFRLVASQSTTLRQPGYAGGPSDGTAFALYAAAQIGGGAQGTAVANPPATFAGSGTTCP
ncbi:Ig-like domain-containing protein [Nocardioides antri]|uniref:Tandem-95 repeat protein n=1 Tax=Nocardioides antri TaxID=2607659 RepID=A0A5B1LZ12_9ACTN|nr:Ig-like domain-containing protein [Nocardioides antri]KAA1426185.1 tandem-95 repeat protein [Nocardioides antri]